ncbi:MAG: hypothetical protein GY705_26720 [Bacteroidetes bacterium]|nr:hypothetical protein [Bacteroidota bacterium]
MESGVILTTYNPTFGFQPKLGVCALWERHLAATVVPLGYADRGKMPLPHESRKLRYNKSEFSERFWFRLEMFVKI